MSRLLSLGLQLLLLLLLWSFLCFVIQQNFISLFILCYLFSTFPSLSCPFFLFWLLLDKVSEYDGFKGHHDTDGSQFHILPLHHTSPVDGELKCNNQKFPADILGFVFWVFFKPWLLLAFAVLHLTSQPLRMGHHKEWSTNPNKALI